MRRCGETERRFRCAIGKISTLHYCKVSTLPLRHTRSAIIKKLVTQRTKACVRVDSTA